MKSDTDPEGDLDDVKDDVQVITHLRQASVFFGWYEEGYDKEPTDSDAVDANGTHASYITHHNGPHYDHVQPPVRRFGPDNSLITNGPRVPFLVISP